MLNITEKKEKDTITFALAGRLDTTTAPQLEKALSDMTEETQLVFDLEGLEYVSSAGLRVLLYMRKKMIGRGEMKIVHVGEAVMDIFEVTGFTDILNIE